MRTHTHACTHTLFYEMNLYFMKYIPTIGFSLITNMVVMNIDTDAAGPNHEEVLETSQRRAVDMQNLVKAVVSKITLTS